MDSSGKRVLYKDMVCKLRPVALHISRPQRPGVPSKVSARAMQKEQGPGVSIIDGRAIHSKQCDPV